MASDRRRFCFRGFFVLAGERFSLLWGPFVLNVRRLFSGLDSTRFLYFSAATGPRGEVLDVVQGAVNPVHWGINPG